MRKSHDNQIDSHVAYAIGHTEAWLEIYARSIPLPGAAQAGTVLGAPGSLPAVLGHSTEGGQALEPLEVAGRAHRNSSQAAHRALTKGVASKASWAKLSPRQRRIRINRMLRGRKRKNVDE